MSGRGVNPDDLALALEFLDEKFEGYMKLGSDFQVVDTVYEMIAYLAKREDRYVLVAESEKGTVRTRGAGSPTMITCVRSILTLIDSTGDSKGWIEAIGEQTSPTGNPHYSVRALYDERSGRLRGEVGMITVEENKHK